MDSNQIRFSVSDGSKRASHVALNSLCVVKFNIWNLSVCHCETLNAIKICYNQSKAWQLHTVGCSSLSMCCPLTGGVWCSEVHAGGPKLGEEPATAQTVWPVACCHCSDQLEVCGGPAQGVPHEGETHKHSGASCLDLEFSNSHAHRSSSVGRHSVSIRTCFGNIRLWILTGNTIQAITCPVIAWPICFII